MNDLFDRFTAGLSNEGAIRGLGIGLDFRWLGAWDGGCERQMWI